MSLTASCLCGAVRIDIRAEPLRVGICHCLDCRKRQGAMFHTFAVYPLAAATVRGETRSYESRRFCPTCGSPLFDVFGDEIEVGIGALDLPDPPAPTYESWIVRRAKWLPAFDVVHRYEHDRG